MDPLVSINIPSKDRAHLVGSALRSIIRQTFTDYEIVLVNDGSIDNTKEVIAAFQAEHPTVRMTIIHHDGSRGVAVSRQDALLASKAKYIAVLDDDDEWIHDGKLKMQMDYLVLHPEVGMLGTWARMIDSATGEEWLWQAATEDADIRKQFLTRNPFVNPTIIFDRQTALDMGGYDSKQEYADDYGFCIALGTKTKMHILPEYTVRFQINAGGMTDRHRLKFITAGLGYAKKYRHDYPGYYRALVKWYLQIFIISVFGPTAWSRLKHAVLKPVSKMYERA